jgi:hypothetical protein
MPKAHFQFQLKADLSKVIGEKKVVASSIGPNGEACLLLVDPVYEKTPFGREERKGFASFPISKLENHYPATFVRFDGGVLQQTELPEVDITFPAVQPLPNGEILLVGARCHYRDGNPEQNAAIHDSQGRVARRFVLGDGIADVQTTKDGMIWVSYFDEGVFGNYGWDKPMGSAGLVSYDLRGRVVWAFEPPDGLDAIADCYALNVAHDAAWAYYYTDFPVVQVQAGKVRAWKNQIGGANALAVDGRRLVLWGGYGDKQSRCVFQEIAGDSLVNSSELIVRFPTGVDPMPIRVRGRGSTLHAFVENSWLAFSLDAIR